LLLLIAPLAASMSHAPHARSPAAFLEESTCKQLLNESACFLRDGCAWCFEDGDRSSSQKFCMAWQECGGPSSLCELRGNESTCNGKDGDPNKTSNCRWCLTESRCVTGLWEGGNVSKADQGQCVGCDGEFDSGADFDVCEVCGGACVEPYIRTDNPSCSCLGCDGTPFSGLVVDACGVCGGSNDSCTIYPFTFEQSIGVSLALSGNFVISLSLNLQKYTHNQNQELSGGERSYTDIPLWWVGMGLMVLGETGNFLAYAYAPATLVAPLGAVTVISNSILAHYVLKEDLRPRNVAGVVLAILGAVLIVVYAPDSQKQLTMELLEQYMSETSFIIFIIFILLTITGLHALGEQYKKRYVVLYLLMCSLYGSLTVMCVKGVSTAFILTMSGHNAFNHLLPWVLVITMIVTTITQIRILNLAMINFGASEVVPVYYVLFTFCSVVGGMVLYKEYHQNCPDQDLPCNKTLFFLLGIFVTFSGVYLITFSRKQPDLSYRYDEPLSLSNDEERVSEREGLLAETSLEEGERMPRELRELATVSVSGAATSSVDETKFLPSEL